VVLKKAGCVISVIQYLCGRNILMMDLTRMNKLLCLPALFCIFSVPAVPCMAQVRVAPDRYRIEFTDKAHNMYVIDRPNCFLSERALQRRNKQGVKITQADLPVSRHYTDSLSKMGIEVLNTSRWFNSAVVHCTAADIERLQNTDFIKHVTAVQRETARDTTTTAEHHIGEFLFSSIRNSDEKFKVSYAASPEYYGYAAVQTGMMNGQILHNNGFRGKGMLIAVLDGGFYRIEELSGFEALLKEGRVLSAKNFTAGSSSSSHGSNVLSIIASNLPGKMVGAAPDAGYILLHSEETEREYVVEEDNWIAAVEYADSTGADIITSSLGYSVFDDKSQNHTYRDMDGRTRASHAAAMAAARGMIVCISAGNEGGKPWKYISIPADADSIVAIGAVDRQRQYASFSSTGPTADGRIKPDLMAMGKGTAYQNSRGQIETGNGTSYSAPLLAGLIACAWQAYPDKGNMEIIEMVKQSADCYEHPDTLYGYGIPDFSKMLPPGSRPPIPHEAYKTSVFSDPSTDAFTLFLSPAAHGRIHIRISTISGHQIFSHTGYIPGYNAYELSVGESAGFAAGMYIVEVQTAAGKSTVKAVKQ
jgi:hypothetical protein